MSLDAHSLKAIAPYLKGRVLALGYPDILSPGVDPFREVDLTCVDLVSERGEIVADLNEPQDLGEFDLVIDHGTTEHCFNVGQAIKNAAKAVKVGGHIFHSPPLWMVNHGYYNFCPTSLWDFYDQNGWEIKRFEARRLLKDESHPISRGFASSRYAGPKLFPGEESVLCMIAQKKGTALNWPTQGKYR